MKPLKVKAKLPEIDDDVFVCLQCGYCRDSCPTYDETGWESTSPRGKIYYLKRLLQRSFWDRLLGHELDVPQEFVDSIYLCTTCGNCKEVCQEKIDTVELWEQIRKWMVDNGYGPMEKHRYGFAFLNATRNPFNEPPENREAWLPKDFKNPEKAHVAYFTGCTAAYRRSELALMTFLILQKAGVDFTVLGSEEWCCGSFILRTGQDSIFEGFANHNIDVLKSRSVREVISACAGCFRTMTIDYPKELHDSGIKVYHVSQYLYKLLKEGTIKFERPINRKITYHDPCHLGRHMEVYDEPRELIKSIPGVEFVEMELSGPNARCCGAGGGFKAAFSSMAVNIGSKRAQDALEVGAEQVISTCPFCKLNIRDGVKQLGIELSVVDIVELVAEAMGLEIEPLKEEQKAPSKKKTATKKSNK